MELQRIISEKITSLYYLISQIKEYWANIEVIKPTKEYKSIELEVRIYTFLEEDTEENPQIVYIMRKKRN